MSRTLSRIYEGAGCRTFWANKYMFVNLAATLHKQGLHHALLHLFTELRAKDCKHGLFGLPLLAAPLSSPFAPTPFLFLLFLLSTPSPCAPSPSALSRLPLLSAPSLLLLVWLAKANL